jgi:hypothetical protein
MLLKQGTTSAEDAFVEVHVWGPMTARTFERVIAVRGARPSSRKNKSTLRELRRRLQALGVHFDEQ